MFFAQINPVIALAMLVTKVTDQGFAPNEYSRTGALAREQWSDTVHYEVQQKVFFHRHGMVGPDKGDEDDPFDTEDWYPIVQKSEIGKGKGAKVTMPMVLQLEDDGQAGNDALTNNEESIRWANMEVELEQRRHATGYTGPLSEIRNPAHSKKLIVKLLTNWLIKKRESDIFHAFYNSYSKHLIDKTALVATNHPNSYFGVGKEGFAAMDDLDVFNCNFLDYIILWFKLNHINPIRMKNSKKGGIVILASPYQIDTLAADPKFQAILNSAGPRDMNENPIFTDADYKYRNCYIYETDRVFRPDQTPHGEVESWENTYGAIVLGAHAMACGSGGVGNRGAGNIQYGIVPSDKTDYENEVEYGIRTVYGDALANWTDETSGAVFNQSSAIFWSRAVTQAW